LALLIFSNETRLLHWPRPSILEKDFWLFQRKLIIQWRTLKKLFNKNFLEDCRDEKFICYEIFLKEKLKKRNIKQVYQTQIAIFWRWIKNRFDLKNFPHLNFGCLIISWWSFFFLISFESWISLDFFLSCFIQKFFREVFMKEKFPKKIENFLIIIFWLHENKQIFFQKKVYYENFSHLRNTYFLFS